MNRTTTALLAALEALITIAIGILIPLVPLTVLWATTFGMTADWLGFWNAAVDIWLLGHGVDLAVHLPQQLAIGIGLPGAEQPFFLTIALLGFSVLTVILGLYAGRRSTESRMRVVGVVVAVVVFEALAVLATLSTGTEVVRASRVQSAILPGLLYAAAVYAGSEWAMQRGPEARRDAVARSLRSLAERLPTDLAAGFAAAARGAAIAVAGLFAVSSVVVAVMLLTGYATITGLFEALQAGAVGGAALTVLQLSLVPNVIIWAASWIVGPGFAVGAGSSLTPDGTVLTAVPGLPIFGALPQGVPPLGWIGVLVPIAFGLAAGWNARSRIRTRTPLVQQATIGGGIGLLSGGAMGLLAAWSGGAMGPGRLAEVGPDALAVSAWAALEIGVPAIVGVLAASLAHRVTGTSSDAVERAPWSDRAPSPAAGPADAPSTVAVAPHPGSDEPAGRPGVLS